MIDYSRILSIFYAGKAWVLNGETYEGLDWFDSDPKPTKEELDSKWEETKSIYNKENCKNKAKALLASSDWAELPSSIELLENANEWKAYRVEVKKLLISPVEAPSFPSAPEVRWKA
jgi:hypothetical protein